MNVVEEGIEFVKVMTYVLASFVVAYILMAGIHELGHAVVLWFQGGTIESIHILTLDPKVQSDLESVNRWVYLGGPVATVISLIGMALLSNRVPVEFRLFFYVMTLGTAPGYTPVRWESLGEPATDGVVLAHYFGNEIGWMIGGIIILLSGGLVILTVYRIVELVRND